LPGAGTRTVRSKLGRLSDAATFVTSTWNCRAFQRLSTSVNYSPPH